MLKKNRKWIGVLTLLVIHTVVLLLLMKHVNRTLLEQDAVLSGTPQNIIKINTVEEYLEFSEAVSSGNTFENSQVLLGSDLDFSNYDHVEMIGDENHPFAGIFDGAGHEIYGLKIHHFEENAGMFALLQGTVKNLRMENCEFSGTVCGAVAAQCDNGSVLNCYIDAKTEGKTAGSLVGRLHGNVINCVAESEIFAGEIGKGIVECCYMKGMEETDTLNKNLAYISGSYQDTEFCIWQVEKAQPLSSIYADLLKSFTARMWLDGKELKLKAYYSENDRKWCIVLPALQKDAALSVEAVTSQGGYEGFERKQGEEEILFTWKDIYYPIEFLCADHIDTLYITLEKQKNLRDIHGNKTKEIPGVLTSMNSEGNVEYGVIKGFYGHGNDSWAVEKKSYNLKLNERTDLLGMGENEDFSLLACYRDNSLMSYCTTTELMKELGFPYSPQFRLVNLYVAGEYAGIYFLAEKVELDENRIEISSVYEETKAVNHDYLEGFPMQEWKNEDSAAARYYYQVACDPEDITGGYLLEADIVDYGPDESRFVSERGIPMTMKRARFSSEAQVNYIADYWQEFEDALFAENGVNSSGRHYSEYIDLESFAMQWLLYELVQEGSMSSSIYFYKESEITGDGLLHACFPWDMEHSYVMSDQLGNIWNLTEKAETLYGYWKSFYGHEDFREELRRVWNEKFIPAIDKMIAEEVVVTENGMKNLCWYEEWIGEMDHLENSRWRKMYPLNRCQTNREFLTIRKDVLSAWLTE